MFLMGLGRKDDERTLGSVTLANPTVGKEVLLLPQNNLRFMWAVTRFPAAHGLGAACVDSEFESKDSRASTFEPSFLVYRKL
jgi:hypothetical protein